MKTLSVLFVLMIAIVGCQKLLPKVTEDDKTLDGAIGGLTMEQHARFLSGDNAFNNEIFTKETGLGPLFVATSCGTCHAGDGKGHPFTTLTRFGQVDITGNQFLQKGGPQLQHRALPGFLPEQVPLGATFAKFMPPANTGLGFLEAVPDATLLALADEQDLDGDGISGKPNWITIPSYINVIPEAIQQNGKYIGRFGKKASVYNLLQQTAGAYNQDIGITSTYEPFDTYTSAEIDPEVSNKTLLDVVFYLQTLKAPIQRNPTAPLVQQGKQLFIQMECGKCHTPQLQTGQSMINALSDKTIFPFSDLLLHDMGTALNDGYTEGSAKTAEWRTPPLWGLGLSKISQGGQYFLLHDGRAKSIEEAILFHGGEGQQSKLKFQQLTTEEKKSLLTFLESL